MERGRDPESRKELHDGYIQIKTEILINLSLG